jgi:imidazolonepropionase-like amidohydrolase
MRVIEIETGRMRELRIEGGCFREDAPISEGAAPGWVLPGLADVHNHLSLASPAGKDAEPAVRVRASASLELALGVLAMREPGSHDGAAAALSKEKGWPRIVTAGRFLAPRNGYFPGLARVVDDETLAGAAVEEAKASGGWAKIIGDFMGEGGRFVSNWKRDVLVSAVRAVHDMGGRVAVHAVSQGAIEDAIDARIDSIEHGWAISDRHFAEMRERRVAWVPTLIEGGAHTACMFAEKMGVDPATVTWMRDVVANQAETVARAHAAGITVLAGTDAGQGPHGRIVEQIELLAAGGMPVRDAIGAASWAARRYLGLPGMEVGAPADLVVYRRDPCLDLAELRRPAVIMLGGHVIHRETDRWPTA